MTKQETIEQIVRERHKKTTLLRGLIFGQAKILSSTC
jgi:hypothetical protein